jgi:pyruvate-formate lyase-activating enzyme
MDQPIHYIKAYSIPTYSQFVAQERARLTPAEQVRFDHYRRRYEQNPKEKIVDDFPPQLQLEPTSICNYRCTFCFQTNTEWSSAESGDMGKMDLDLFRHAVDEAHGRVEAVNIASRGEPLLHPYIDRMLAYVAGKFVAFKLNTNGWFLNERRARALLECDLMTLVISADAASEPAYSQLRVGGQLARIVKNVEAFATLRLKSYPRSRLLLRVSGVKVPGTPELEEMKKLWGDLADQVCFTNYNPWEDVYSHPINNIQEACTDLWRRTFVWWNGIINCCDVDYKSTLAVGHFPQSSIAEVWTGKKYQELRDNHLNNLRSRCSPCNKCTVV